MESVALLSGAVFDNKFVILEPLGSGGMGSVYKARQIGFERIVALKLLSTALAESDDSTARFEREAKVLSVLQHKNIASFFLYAVSADHVPYLAMEYVEGDSLRKRFSSQARQSWRWSLQMVLQICDALSYAHKNGIIHRDLKPENIMISGEGQTERVVLIDFGLSKITDPQMTEVQKLTQTGDLIGSVNYLSPELAKGLKPDSRSDVYGLGVILYEAVSGSLPFAADTPMGVIYKHANEQAAALDVDYLNIPIQLRQIIQKSISKDPARRYQGAEELAADIKALLDDKLDQIEAHSDISEQQKSFPFLVVVLPLVVVALLVVFFAVAKAPVNPNKVLEKAKEDSQKANQSNLTSMTIEAMQRRVEALSARRGGEIEGKKFAAAWFRVQRDHVEMTPAKLTEAALFVGGLQLQANDYGIAREIYQSALQKLRADSRSKPEELIQLISGQTEAIVELNKIKELKEPIANLKTLLEQPELPKEARDLARYGIALATLGQGHNEQVLQYINQECADLADQKRFVRLRAICLFRLGKTDEGKSMALAYANAQNAGKEAETKAESSIKIAHEAASCAEYAKRYDIAIELLEPTIKNSPPDPEDRERALALLDLAAWSLNTFADKGISKVFARDRTEDRAGWLDTIRVARQRNKEAAEIYGNLGDTRLQFRAEGKVAYMDLLAHDDRALEKTIQSMYELFPSNPEYVSRWEASQIYADGVSAISSGWYEDSIRALRKAIELYSLVPNDEAAVIGSKRAKSYYAKAQELLQAGQLKKRKIKENGKERRDL